MKTFVLAALASVALPAVALAEAPAVPAEAKQLKGAEIGQWIDGKTFDVEVFDAKFPIVAESSWDLAKARVGGTYSSNGETGNFEREWKIKGNTSCSYSNAISKWECYKIYVLGDTMYEVTRKGAVHAISKVK